MRVSLREGVERQSHSHHPDMSFASQGRHGAQAIRTNQVDWAKLEPQEYLVTMYT